MKIDYDNPNPSKKSITKSLAQLNSLIHEKISFKEKKKDKKIIKDLKKVEINYQQYLRHHQKMPSILVSSFRMMSILDLISRKQMKIAFMSMKKLKNKKQVEDRDLKIIILIESIEIIKRKKQYLNLNWGFRQVRLHWQGSKESEQLESVRIFSCKNKETYKQLDIDEESISNHLLDLSVYESKSHLFNAQKESEENLLIRLNFLEGQILAMKNKINKAETIKEIEVSYGQKIQSPIQDCSQSNKSSMMKQNFSFSNLNNLKCQETLGELLEKNLALQEEADLIRVTNDNLLEMSRKSSDLNPQLLSILQQVRRILQPSPLGLVNLNF